MNRKIKDIVGRTFGRLTVLSFVELRNHRAIWACVCACGNNREVTGTDLRSGNTRSCGCLMREIAGSTNKSHGEASGDPAKYGGAYRSWRSLFGRCEQPKNRSYPNYGGRGIRICDRWRSFPAFLADMGERPAGHSIERKNVNVGYEPGNCVWLPTNKQAANQRTTVRWALDGEVMTQAEAARKLGTHPANLLYWRKHPSAMPEPLRARLQSLQALTT
jgi:hypothetical protein